MGNTDAILTRCGECGELDELRTLETVAPDEHGEQGRMSFVALCNGCMAEKVQGMESKLVKSFDGFVYVV